MTMAPGQGPLFERFKGLGPLMKLGNGLDCGCPKKYNYGRWKAP